MCYKVCSIEILIVLSRYEITTSCLDLVSTPLSVIVQLKELLKIGPSPASFSLCSSFQQITAIHILYKMLPMTGFKLWTHGIGKDWFANWVATTAQIERTFKLSHFLLVSSFRGTFWATNALHDRHLSTVWADLAKFCHFGKILKAIAIFWHFI